MHMDIPVAAGCMSTGSMGSGIHADGVPGPGMRQLENGSMDPRGGDGVETGDMLEHQSGLGFERAEGEGGDWSNMEIRKSWNNLLRERSMIGEWTFLISFQLRNNSLCYD